MLQESSHFKGCSALCLPAYLREQIGQTRLWPFSEVAARSAYWSDRFRYFLNRDFRSIAVGHDVS